MNKSIATQLSIVLAIVFLLQNCKPKTEETTQPEKDLTSQILIDYSANICLFGYQQLALASTQLNDDIKVFAANPSQASLEQCKTDWKNTRKIWEESEAYLFGPVSTNSIDPRIDTWPVDFNRLDSILAGSTTFTQAYVDQLEESLKGFHPIEYLLYGKNGNKKYTDFTGRQKEYLKALAENLKTLTASLKNDWEVKGGNFFTQFTTAGAGSTLYPTKRSAYEEMVNAMIGICDEVANGKIDEVFTTLDSMKEESPFAKNSITDFTNNIQGVLSCYLSKSSINDGKGLEDFVRQFNLSLDGNIKQKHAAAIAALNNVTMPFGQAIFHQQIQVQAAVDAINDLKDELEGNLLPLVQLQIK